MSLKVFVTGLIILFGHLNDLTAKEYTQTIRGTIVERILQKPIEGASIRIEGTTKGCKSDSNGQFVLSNLPLGTYNLIISSVGFKENVQSNIVLSAGKELVLTIQMDERIQSKKEIVIKGESRRNKTINEMSVVSARTFSVEETQKYAAAVNDPARMATNFAGVASADDGNNLIVIRGNAPNTILWRMEGIDIPNPNHFASVGSSGGGISILSAQVLSNADFVTGAFASEYGNALGGVFDLRLRKGNNQKKEYTFSAGLLGINAAIEGPFSKNYNGSYLINYRYSTLGILSKIGISLPGNTNFQDLSFNVFLPTKKMGAFTLFSFAGLSDQTYAEVFDSTKWKVDGDRYGNTFNANTGLWGITHAINLSQKAYLKTGIAYSLNENKMNVNYIDNDYSRLNVFNENYITKKLTITSTLNRKFSARSSLRSGLIMNLMDFNYKQQLRDQIHSPLKNVLDNKQATQSIQAFTQWQYKLSDALVVNTGLHFMTLMLNSSGTVEPRASLQWIANQRNTLSFGYGKHSQLQGFGVYFAQVLDQQQRITYPNKSLGFSKADHYVISHIHTFKKELRLKTEAYYQSLHNIPVSVSTANSFSAINAAYDQIRDPMVNKGRGKNYGLEMSLEKSLSNRSYYLIATSFYQSTFVASNGKTYNTRYNGNIVLNAVIGKDFPSKNNRRTLGLNLKTVYAGGYRETPIDISQSHIEQKTVYIQSQAYANQLPAYMRADFRISMKWNRKHFNSTLSLDIQNVTNRKNVYGRFYDALSNSIKTYFQTPLIPILNYKIEF